MAFICFIPTVTEDLGIPFHYTPPLKNIFFLKMKQSNGAFRAALLLLPLPRIYSGL